MARTILNLENLGALAGGQAQAIIDAALARAVADFDDRGDDCKPRKVTILVTITKDQPGQEQAKVDVQARVQVPGYRTGITMAQTVQKQGKPILVFQEHNPERSDQETFPGMDG